MSLEVPHDPQPGTALPNALPTLLPTPQRASSPALAATRAPPPQRHTLFSFLFSKTISTKVTDVGSGHHNDDTQRSDYGRGGQDSLFNWSSGASILVDQ